MFIHVKIRTILYYCFEYLYAQYNIHVDTIQIYLVYRLFIKITSLKKITLNLRGKVFHCQCIMYFILYRKILYFRFKNYKLFKNFL